MGKLFITFSFHGHSGCKGHFIPDPLHMLYFICGKGTPKGLHSNCSSLLPQPTPSPTFLSILSPTSFTNSPFPHIYSISHINCLMLFLFCEPICCILINPRAFFLPTADLRLITFSLSSFSVSLCGGGGRLTVPQCEGSQVY